jgi:hypothetical protein
MVPRVVLVGFAVGVTVAVGPSALRAADAAPARSPPAQPSTATAGNTPASMPVPLTEQEIVERAAAAAEHLAAVERDTQQKLKGLAGQAGRDADEARKALLVGRRQADRQAYLAKRRLRVHWLARSLPEDRLAEIDRLPDDDLDALLDARTTDQRLAVPLPPRRFENAPLQEVLEFVDAESEARVLADWPALNRVGVAKSDLVSFDVGRYARPAADVLRQVLAALATDKAVVDAGHAGAVLVSTRAGLDRLAEMDRLLAPRVRDPRAWADARLAGPVSLTGVPLATALDTVLADVPAEVQADKLEAAGLTAETPVTLSLGIHRPGHAAAALADVLNAHLAQRQAVGQTRPGGAGVAPQASRPAQVQLPPAAVLPEALPQGGVAFDLAPDGVLILSTRRGLTETMAAADWLALAVANAADLKPLIDRRMPELRVDGMPLADLVTSVRNATGIDLRPDWQALAASGLNPRTPITLSLADAPVAQVLRLMFTPPAGRPPVTWQADGKTLRVRSAGAGGAR